MRTFDAQTGKILDDDLRMGEARPFSDVSVAPNPNQIATFLGVPVGWVIIAGLVLLFLPSILKR